MSHPNPTHERDNEYPDDDTALAPSPLDGLADRIMRKIAPALYPEMPKANGRLFGPRSDQNPV